MFDPNILAYQIQQEIAVCLSQCRHDGSDWRAVLMHEHITSVQRLADFEAEQLGKSGQTDQAFRLYLSARIEGFAAELKKIDASKVVT